MDLVKVLIGSPAFPPSRGGLERFVEQLATGLARSGDEVTVMTGTPANAPDRYRFRVARGSGGKERLWLFREAEVFLQVNLALRDLWPLTLIRVPWVVSHHGVYGGEGLQRAYSALKVAVARRADRAISVSRFVAEAVDRDSVVVPNAYRSDLFREMPGIGRDLDLLFVGRLVSDKGCEVLLEALSLISRRLPGIRLTIVGSGPEENRLRERSKALSLSDQVAFRGWLEGEELARELNRHRIAVVPSLVEEGFGLVALEAIACGCVVVGSRSGGLVEAIGACGRTVKPGDAADLAATLEELLAARDLSGLRAHAREHLAAHSESAMIKGYQDALRQAVGSAE